VRLAADRYAVLAVVLVALAVLVASPAVVAQSGATGNKTFVTPEATDEGDWYGTWYHQSRERLMAIWIRKADPGPEIQLRYFRLGGGEQFVTDWHGKADYKTPEGAPGHFALDVSNASADQMAAAWQWTLEFADSARLETGDVSIYRSGDGRVLVLLFNEFERRIRRGPNWESGGGSHALTFRKASKRIIPWEELPF